MFQKVHLDRNVLSGFVYYDKGAGHGDGKRLAVEFVDVGSVVVVFHYQVDFVIDDDEIIIRACRVMKLPQEDIDLLLQLAAEGRGDE